MLIKKNSDRQLMTITVFGAGRLAIEGHITKRPNYSMNRRAEIIHQLWKELRTFAKLFKAATEEEKPQLVVLPNIIRQKLHRAKWH